jgi:hypothetical protein
MTQKALLLIAILASLPEIALAQSPPSPPYYAMDPHAPMAPGGAGPLQQQIIENYRTQLLQSQRSLAQQNPAGTSPTQLDINHQLSQYNSAPTAAPILPSTTAPPLANPVSG